MPEDMEEYQWEGFTNVYDANELRELVNMLESAAEFLESSSLTNPQNRPEGAE